MPALKAYLSALWHHALGIVRGGSLVIVLALWERYTGKNVPWGVYVTVMALGVLTATFRAWEDQYRKAIEAEVRLRNEPLDLAGLRAWTQEQLQAQQERLQAQQDRIETTMKRRAALKWLTRQERPIIQIAQEYQHTHASAASERSAQEIVAEVLDYVEKQLGGDYRRRLTDTTGILLLPGRWDLSRLPEEVPTDKIPLMNQLLFMISRVRQIIMELKLEEEGIVTKKAPE